MSGDEKATSDLMVDKQQRMSSPSANRASKISKHPTGSDRRKDKKHKIPDQHSQKYSRENQNGNIFSQNLKKAPEIDLTTTNYHFGDIVEREEKCVSRLIKLIFSTPGLVAMVIIYSIMGATIFPLIETSENVSKTALITRSREECLKELWTITEKLNVLYESNWTLLVHEQLRRFEGTIVAATRHGAANLLLSAEISENSLSQFDSLFDTVDNENQMAWSFSEALLYSITVITTIGHGSMTPRTAGGKVATILYALIGVPLMLMCLSSLGTLLAGTLHRTYTRLHCNRRQFHDATPEKVMMDRQKKCLKVESDSNDEGIDLIKQEFVHCDDARDAKYMISCKICEYNADSCFTRIHNCKNQMEIINTTAVTETQKTKDYFKYRQLRVNKLPSDSFKKTTDPFCQKQPHTDVKANVDKFTLSSSTTSTGVRVPPNKISAQHIYSNRCLGGPSSTGANQTPLLPTQSSQPEPLRNLLTSSTFPVSPTLIQNNFLVASDKKQLIQNTHSNFEAVAANNSVRNSGKDTVMDTTQTATLYVPIIATGTGLTQPVMKYHTIQVPNIKPFGFPSYVTNAPNNNRNCYEEIELSHPKPTCHIAVRQSHDVRRAKFLANPLPKEINILLQENDVICREDLVQRQNLWLSPSSTNTITAGTRKIQSFTMCDDRTLMDGLESDRSGSSNVDKLQSVSMTMWAPTSPTTKIGNISNRKNIFSSFAFLRNTSTQSIENGDVISHKVEPDYISSSISNILPLAYVDHLDDGRRVNNLMISNDSGDETEHYSSCAHGTPSRMPLIRSGSTSNDSKVLSPFVRMSSPSINGFNNAKKTLHFHHSSMNVFPNSSGKFMVQDQKKFQQEGQHQRTQKSIMINSGFKCNRHEERRTSLSPSFCYAGDARSRFNCDNRYNSDDEDDGKELHAFDFLQTNLRRASHFNFCNSPLKPLHFSGKGRIQHHQVPLIIVILILIFYVCLGTMVFALWENWSLIDGAYFCFVTLTTIGCSGLTPEKTLHGPELQLIVCCAYLLLGLVLVAMSFNILETQLMWSCKRLTGRMKLAQD